MTDDNKPPVGGTEDEIRKWADERARKMLRDKQHDSLWRTYGWLPTTIENKVALLSAVGIAVFLGGRPLISNIMLLLERLLP